MTRTSLEINLRDVSKVLGGREVLRNITFTVPRECVMGCLGPDGAGKTTTLRIILGLLRPDQGQVTIGQWRVGPDSAVINRYLGIALEIPALYNHLSAWDNLAFFGKLRGLPRKELYHRITQLLHRFGLREFAEWPVASLTLSTVRKLSLARAFVHHPKLLVLDEPTRGLDRGTRREVLDLVLQMAREDACTVLFTSPRFSSLEEWCDEMVFLNAGRIVCQGSATEIIRRTCPPTIRVGFESEEAAIAAKATLGVLPFVEEVSADLQDLLIRLGGGDIRDVGRLLNRFHIEFLTLTEDRSRRERFLQTLEKGGYRHA